MRYRGKMTDNANARHLLAPQMSAGSPWIRDFAFARWEVEETLRAAALMGVFGFVDTYTENAWEQWRERRRFSIALQEAFGPLWDALEQAGEAWLTLRLGVLYWAFLALCIGVLLGAAIQSLGWTS